MGSVVITEPQPGGKGTGSFCSRVIDRSVCPALVEGLDEALGFAIGPLPVGAGAAVADTHLGTGLAVKVRAVGRSIIGEDPLNHDPLGGKPLHSAQHEAAGGLFLLIRQHLAVDKAGSAVGCSDVRTSHLASSISTGLLTFPREEAPHGKRSRSVLRSSDNREWEATAYLLETKLMYEKVVQSWPARRHDEMRAPPEMATLNELVPGHSHGPGICECASSATSWGPEPNASSTA